VGCQPAGCSGDVRRRRPGGDALLSVSPRGGALSPPCPMFLALAGAELPLGTGTTTAPSQPIPSDYLFLSPTFVQTLAADLAVDEVFGPIMRRAAAALGTPVDRRETPLAATAHAQQGGAFRVSFFCCTAAGRTRLTDSASPPVVGCWRRCSTSATTASHGDTSGAPKQGPDPSV
jgi:hypothetical protein